LVVVAGVRPTAEVAEALKAAVNVVTGFRGIQAAKTTAAAAVAVVAAAAAAAVTEAPSAAVLRGRPRHAKAPGKGKGHPPQPLKEAHVNIRAQNTTKSKVR
jgi:hypothetical protein